MRIIINKMLGSELLDVPEEYLCPMTHEIMEYPFVAADGHSYEYSAIHEWLKRGKKVSPLTGEELKHGLTENHRLRIEIKKYKDDKLSRCVVPLPKHDMDMAIKIQQERCEEIYKIQTSKHELNS